MSARTTDRDANSIDMVMLLCMPIGIGILLLAIIFMASDLKDHNTAVDPSADTEQAEGVEDGEETATEE